MVIFNNATVFVLVCLFVPSVCCGDLKVEKDCDKRECLAPELGPSTFKVLEYEY